MAYFYFLAISKIIAIVIVNMRGYKMDIKESLSGKIINTLTGYKAFIPNHLPPIIEWDITLVNSLSRADYILGMLSREGARLPNPHLLMRPFLTREAVLSSKIEGTQATLGEVLAQEAGIQVDRISHPGRVACTNAL